MILIALLIPIFLGYLLIRAVWPGPLCRHECLRWSLGPMLGLGICSELHFLSLAVSSKALAGDIAEIALLLVLAALVWRSRARACAFCPSAPPDAPTALDLPLRIGVGLGAVSSVACFWLISVMGPHGEWDAWSIWNLRARFLARGGDHWSDAFSNLIAWAHPDYPLLVPASISRLWQYAGSEPVAGPILVASLLTAAAAGVLASTLLILRGRLQALIALIVLIGAVAFVRDGAAQYADVPVAAFVIAAVSLLALQERFSGDRSFTILAGLAAGLAAWTKNEGLLFAGVALGSIWIGGYHRRTVRELSRSSAAFVAGALPALAAVAIFKVRYAPPNDLLSQSNVSSRALDVQRYFAVLYEFGREQLLFGGFLVPILLVLAAYGWCLGLRRDSWKESGLRTAVSCYALMLAGYFCIYVFLSRDLDWQIGTSLNRLFVQLWPLLLLCFFLLVRSPIETATVLVEKHVSGKSKRASKK